MKLTNTWAPFSFIFFADRSFDNANKITKINKIPQ